MFDRSKVKCVIDNGNLVWMEIELPPDIRIFSIRKTFMDHIELFLEINGKLPNTVMLSVETLTRITRYEEYRDECKQTPIGFYAKDGYPNSLYGLTVSRTPPLNGVWIGFIDPEDSATSVDVSS